MSARSLASGARRGLDQALRTICVVLFALLVVLVSWQVFTRLMLGDPSAWSEEAARYTFVWAMLIGISIAVGEKADVVMDVVVERLPLAAQRVTDVLAHTASLLFVLYAMVYGGVQLCRLAWSQNNPLLPFSQGQLYLALPVSGVILTLYLVVHIAGTFGGDYTGHTGGPDEDLEAASL